MASTPRQTTSVSVSASKRVLSSPVELMDTKKSKINIEPVIIEEVPQAVSYPSDVGPGNSQVPVSAENVGYPTMTITLSEDHITQITSSIQESINTQIEDMVAKIVNGVLGGLRSRMSDLEEENQQLKRRLQVVETRLDSAEQYSRRNCIRISGVPETNGESVEDKIMLLADPINSNLTIEEVDRAHRVGKPKVTSHTDRPRDIIVEFVSYRSRQKLMKLKSQLKHKGYKGTFINEDLTKVRRDIFFQARKMVKEKRVVSAWTYDGTIFVKDPNLRVHRVECQSDLESLAQAV